ncbi:uncharacterized protein JN550_009080 [Neoarthrinium moseri]|uniref:uncharacterized protein n=1 Tax=Neoarthrinium moseri TaxID=1658444 RepID=UPI001FDB679D|nr:uncharacterized protein JN550_009080 [Neoarthrinium moseri]KAI1864060.1 hypothetical protein JN550_009080 [Neoarthrinium moseri]
MHIITLLTPILLSRPTFAAPAHHDQRAPEPAQTDGGTAPDRMPEQFANAVVIESYYKRDPFNCTQIQYECTHCGNDDAQCAERVDCEWCAVNGRFDKQPHSGPGT